MRLVRLAVLAVVAGTLVLLLNDRVEATGSVDGYWLLDASGEVYAFGDAPFLGSVEGMDLNTNALKLAAHPTQAGYWVLDSAGRVHSFGIARNYGDVELGILGATELPSSIAATASGLGYWVFTTDGRALAFGDAEHYGDLVELGVASLLAGPIVDSVRTPSGRGYFLVGSDGGVFTFGDASFEGSMGGIPLNSPVNGLVPDPDGTGYWLVAGDGGVFAFSAPFVGSIPGLGIANLAAPVNGMVAFGDGYLMVASDGGVFNFSSKPFSGSLAGQAVSSVAAISPIASSANLGTLSEESVRNGASPAVCGHPASVFVDGSAVMPPGTDGGIQIDSGDGFLLVDLDRDGRLEAAVAGQCANFFNVYDIVLVFDDDGSYLGDATSQFGSVSFAFREQLELGGYPSRGVTIVNAGNAVRIVGMYPWKGEPSCCGSAPVAIDVVLEGKEPTLIATRSYGERGVLETAIRAIETDNRSLFETVAEPGSLDGVEPTYYSLGPWFGLVSFGGVNVLENCGPVLPRASIIGGLHPNAGRICFVAGVIFQLRFRTDLLEWRIVRASTLFDDS